jgi:uncharacterized protein YbjT (DUF2867 family)
MILVTGAAGNVGRHVVADLVGRGVPVRGLVEPGFEGELPDGVEVVRGDLTDGGTQAGVVDGVEGVFLLAIPGAAPGVAAAAKKAGVRRIVTLSSITADEEALGRKTAIGAFHRSVETAVEESGVGWTHLRPYLLASNALMWAPGIKAEGVVRGPYAQAATAPIHERDVAAVAVPALLGDEYAGVVHPLTGPQSLTQAEQVQIIGEAIGKSLRYEEVPADAARQALARQVPPEAAEAMVDFLASCVGRDAVLTPTVHDVTGMPGRTFTQWAVENAPAFGA